MTIAPPRPARPGFVTLLAVHLISLPTGASQALYGPSLPAVVERFAVPVSVAGLLIGAHSAGAFVGILAWALLQRRLGMRAFAAVAATALGLGCVLLASAPTWALMVAGAVLTGAGFGGTASGLNVYLTRLLGPRSTPYLISVAAVFGVGSIAAPAVLGWTGLEGHRLAFAGVAGFAALAAPLLLRSAPVSPAPSTPAGRRRPDATALLFMVVVGLYVALEVGVGGWAATHLVGVGHDPASAARWTAAFWSAFTIGRFVATPLASRVAPWTLVLGAVAATTLAVGVATFDGAAPVAYTVAGLALAPVFPALYAWYSRVAGTATLVSALFFLAGSVGAAVLPPLIGVLAGATAPAAIPVALTLLAAAATALLLRLRTLTAGRADASAGT